MALFSYFLFGYFWSLNRSIGRLSLSCRPADRAQVRCLHITAPSQVRSLSQSSRLLPAHQTVRHIRQDSVDEILNNCFFFVLLLLAVVFANVARRFSSSDSISELDLSTRRAGGGVGGKDTDSPTHGTPPGTPPPPYRRPVSPLAEDGNGSEVICYPEAPARSILGSGVCHLLTVYCVLFSRRRRRQARSQLLIKPRLPESFMPARKPS